MCGIVGSVGRQPADLTSALAALRHRGPDDQGAYAWRQGQWAVNLGFVRLSILDTSAAGHQPMTNEDSSLWLIFNGEIYNYLELREQLVQHGHTFRSHTDSENILHAYEQYGDEFIERLQGMFAFALWDAARERLLVVRDRLGIKPVFWSSRGGRLSFASEIKGLLALGVSREMDPLAVPEYLQHLYIPSPRTIFRDVHALPPGHLLRWERGQIQVERYWDLDRFTERRRGPQLAEELRDLLDKVVKMHLASDVPLGAFLSGGLDSSTLVALMAKHSSQPARTFCMTFGSGEGLYDEREYASEVARKFGTVHQEIAVKPNLVDLLPQVVRHFDQPFGNPTALLTYLLSRETRKHVTVALAGDGGDEVFMGYPRYQGAVLAKEYRRLPTPVRAFLAERIAPLIRESTHGRHSFRRAREFLMTGPEPLRDMYERWVGYYDLNSIRAVLKPPFRPNGSAETQNFVSNLFGSAPTDDFLEQVSYVDLKSFLPENLLQYSDRTSMAHGLEVRVPFCDHRLVEFMASIDSSEKMSWRESKTLLRKAFSDVLPKRILERKKLGFNPPMGIWIERNLRQVVSEKLSPARLRREGFFEPEPIQRMLDQHLAQKRDYSLHLWALLVFQTWVDLYSSERN